MNDYCKSKIQHLDLSELIEGLRGFLKLPPLAPVCDEIDTENDLFDMFESEAAGGGSAVRFRSKERRFTEVSKLNGVTEWNRFAKKCNKVCSERITYRSTNRFPK